MELLQLRYFATVARMENISHAAACHMIPQSAMSKTISKLEQELGTPLFTRVRNRLSLTEEGKCLYHGVQKSLFALDSALLEIKEGRSSEALHGEIKCLILQHRYNLIHCIAEFKHNFPMVRFTISHRLKDFSEYDLCISAFAPTDYDNIGIPLLEESLKIAVSSDHPLANRQSVTLPELRHENFLFLSPDSSMIRILTTHCERYGFRPGSVTYIDDLKCIEKYVSCGLGVAIVPVVSWSHLDFNGSMLLSVEEQLFSRKTFLFCNRLKPLNNASKAFSEYLKQNFKVCFTEAAPAARKDIFAP